MSGESAAATASVPLQTSPRGGRASCGEGLLASAPDDILRQLFQTFRLEVRFDKPSHPANCRVTIDDDSVAAIASNADDSSVFPGWCTDVGSAPGRIRTCAPRSGGACSIP